MKTIFHYLVNLIKKTYKNNPFNIAIPITIIVGLSLMVYGGYLMFVPLPTPGQLTTQGLIGVAIMISGIVVFGFVFWIQPLLATMIYLQDKYENYKTWKASNSKDKTQGANKQ